MAQPRADILENALRTAATPMLFAGLFSLVSNLLYLILPLYINQVYARVIVSQSVATLVVLTAGAVLVFLLSSVIDDLKGRILINFGLVFDKLLSAHVFAALFEAAVRRDTSARAQALRDVDSLRQVVTGTGVAVLFDIPWIPVFLGILFYIDPLVGLATAIGGILLLVLVVAQDRATRASLREANSTALRGYAFVESALRNGDVVRAFGMVPTLGRRWAADRQKVIDLQTALSRRASTFATLIRFTRLAIQVVVVAVGAYLVIQKQLSPAILFANMILSARALAPIERVVASWNALVSGLQAYERLKTLLASYELPLPATVLPKPIGQLSVEQVNLTVPGTTKLLLKQVSFQLRAGETLGIIGESGAGKSTLARLLVGVWKPLSGTVRLDGADVYMWDREEFGKHVGYLPQDIELFAGTVRDNVARFRSDVNDADVVQAAQIAGAHDMILHLPKGYDTDVGDGGAVLSAGQRQRVGLARALLGNPQLIVLDEPNANLDTAGETALITALEALKRQSASVVIVSHKPSMFRSADKMLLLRDGVVEMFGPRDQVLAKVIQRAPVPAQGMVKKTAEG
jgi:PrtD family type I secretion system ABC transporter